VPPQRPSHALDAPPVERRRWVREAFHSIANRYDLLNTVLSGGVHYRWKRRAVEAAQLGPGDVGLDVCCGTGDLAEGIAARVSPGGRAIGLDFAPGMLDVARSRARSKAPALISLICGDAEALPVAGGSVAAITIAFGLRNVANPAQALGEFHRVLRPGGRLVVLEFGRPRARLLRRLYDVYSQTIIPRLGGWLSGRPDAYQYLHDSIRKWPDPDALAGTITRAGFIDVRYRMLTGGIAVLHSAVKR
jgi:demethylmenaquinone methyltransferase/2-methoxy-6-polyprenyl-1,4-benzoquinol methylase